MVFGQRANEIPSSGILSDLENTVMAQGFASLSSWSQSNKTNNSDTEPCFVSSQTILDNGWLRQHVFKDLRSMTSYLVIDKDQIDEAIQTKHLLDDAINSFLQTMPGMAAVLEEYTVMQDGYEKTRSAHKQVIERLAGAEKTIDVVRTKYKDDYENLF